MTPLQRKEEEKDKVRVRRRTKLWNRIDKGLKDESNLFRKKKNI